MYPHLTADLKSCISFFLTSIGFLWAVTLVKAQLVGTTGTMTLMLLHGPMYALLLYTVF